MRLARWRLVGGVAEAQQALARVPARERERTLARARLSAPPRAAASASASARALARILVLVPVLVLARTRVCVRVDARASALGKIAVGGSEGVRGEREGREGQIAQPRLSVSHRCCVCVGLKICGARTRGR